MTQAASPVFCTKIRKEKEASMNRSENRNASGLQASGLQASGLQVAGMHAWRHAALAVAASCAILQSASASPRLTDHPPEGPPPCPNIEQLCGDPDEKPEDPIQPICQCGPGEWVRVNRTPLMNPPAPMQGAWAGSENFVGWRTSYHIAASESSATACISISGSSSFWHAGSRTGTRLAQFIGGWRETWHGTFPACTRSVLLSAVGSGGLGIGDSCAARLGCSASSTATAAGVAMSRGKAYASLSNLEIRGTVTYDDVTHLSKIDGNFGADVALASSHVSGSISSQSSWTVNGQGSATGALTFVVLPDRTYCALTNLPIAANWAGTVVTTTAVTVDENGSASGSAEAALTLLIH